MPDDATPAPPSRRRSRKSTETPAPLAATPATTPVAPAVPETVDAVAPVMTDYVGLLFIGDPHLASRVPGFRKDDYPRTILGKLRFAIDYARGERLMPVLLGDLFDFPRDNANWLLAELHRLLPPQTLAVYGNHDCKENTPGDDDSVSILVASGFLRLLSPERPWAGRINGQSVVVGGTSWGQKLPESFDASAYASGGKTHVAWVTHHDLTFPGYDAARRSCKPLPGIDLVVNGHIHRQLGPVKAGDTLYVNPGNISRIARSDASRGHEPAVLRADVSELGFSLQRVSVPHAPFDEVFHAEIRGPDLPETQSPFIRELARLQAVKTQGGVALRQFLAANRDQFDPAVANEIDRLAEEVLSP